MATFTLNFDDAARSVLIDAITRYDYREPEHEATRERLRDDLAALVAPASDAPVCWRCNGEGCSDCAAGSRVLESMKATMGPALYGWLVDEMGMEPELAGGGCVMLRHTASSGAYVLVTDSSGSGLPSPDSWAVGAYPPFGDSDVQEPFAMFDNGNANGGWAPITLRQAVGAACSIAMEWEAPAEAPDLIERARDYASELDRLELAPNGDDFNALLDILGGAKRQPHPEGR